MSRRAAIGIPTPPSGEFARYDLRLIRSRFVPGAIGLTLRFLRRPEPA